jgi:restriction system protein
MWGIHGGKTGDADTLFLQQNVVALGWERITDLSRLPPEREAYKAAVAENYPNKKPGAIPVDAGQLFRFVNEIRIGDLVAYPSKIDHAIHIGRIEGPYAYEAPPAMGYPHRRPVRWLKSAPRTQFAQGALYEIGSAMSFFQIKNYADAFREVLEGVAPAVSSTDDETVAVVADELEQTTRDFVLKRLAESLKGHPFADFVANLLQTMGYRTRVSPEGPDQGVDIVAHRDELGFEPPIVKVQVKSGEGSVGDPVVSALFGKVSSGEFGLLVTLGTVTTPARQFARTKSNLRLIDGSELVDLVLEHYDELDAQYKGLLPLKRVYVPEPLERS